MQQLPHMAHHTGDSSKRPSFDTCLQSWAQVAQFSPALHLPSPQNGDVCNVLPATRWLLTKAVCCVLGATGGDSGAVTLSSSAFCDTQAA